MSTTLKRVIGAVLAIALVAFLIIGIPLKNAQYTYATTQSFTKDGFVDSMELTNKNKLVSENDNYRLFIDETTSYITLEDKNTGVKWHSNPTVEEPSEDATTAAKNKQKATLEYSYYNEAGSITSVNNYNLSIFHKASVIAAEGQRTFAIKYDEANNVVQVLYTMKSLEISHLYFPKYLSEEQFATFDSGDVNVLKSLAYTKFEERDLNGDGVITDDEKLYYISNYDSSMTLLVKRRAYAILYTKYGYTLEQVELENAKYEIYDQEERVEFEIGVQIKLLDNGIETKIIKESIVEKGAKLAEISIYPLFGTAINMVDGVETEGYMVIPDGTGAVIEFNNTKVTQNAYRKRLYGTDLSVMPYSMPEQQQKISIPVYGMIKENIGGFAAVITEGDAMAYINADISGRIDSYNKIYTSFQLRETESVVLGSGFNKYGVSMWTKDIVQTDFTVEYTFLSGSNNNYVGIANVYRNHLIEKLGMSAKDTTHKTVLTAEFVGAFDKQAFFLGVPYSTLDSLTTFEQAKQIIQELNERNINNLNVSYLGVANGGLTNLLYDRNEVAEVLGGKEGLDSLNNYLADQGINLYQHTNFVTTSKYRGFIDAFRYNAIRVRGSQSMAFEYHAPSRLPSSEYDAENSLDQYVLNPLLYSALYENFSKQSNINGLALDYMGSQLAGHYDYNNTLYKQDALTIQKDLLSTMEENLLLQNPLGFAIPYASYINNLPTETTLYALVDYQVPLLQLVLSDLVDYSTDSINLTSDRSNQYQFLKVLETGSNLKYTLSYESSQALLNTKHNKYMSTHYVNWMDQIEEQVNTIDSLKLHEGRLINHQRLQNNVYQVTYSNGLELIINYNSYAVTIGTHQVTGLNYVVVGGAN